MVSGFTENWNKIIAGRRTMLEIEKKKLTRKYQEILTDNEVEYMYLAKYMFKV